MKKKKCPQCKNLISVGAPTCLYCGRPNKFVTKDYVKTKWDIEYNKNKINIFNVLFSTKKFFIFFIITTLIILFVSFLK